MNGRIIESRIFFIKIEEQNSFCISNTKNSLKSIIIFFQTTYEKDLSEVSESKRFRGGDRYVTWRPIRSG